MGKTPAGEVFDLAFVLNEDSQILHFATSNEELLFVGPSKFLGKKVAEVLPPEAAEINLAAIQKVFSHNTSEAYEYALEIQGETRFFKAFGTPLQNLNLNGKRQAIFTIQDITESKRRANDLKEVNNRFQTIFEMANTGIAFADHTGAMVHVNEAFEKLVGYTMDELKGRHFGMFLQPEEAIKESVLLDQLTKNQLNHFRIEKSFLQKGGETIWVDATISAIRDEHNQLQYFVGVCNDITRRKKQEMQLEALNATKDKLFSIIAHDLRNPLNVISGLVNILVSDFDKEEQRAESKQILEMLAQSALGANILLENLLQWARAQTNTISFFPKKTEVKFIVDDLTHQLEGMARAKKINLRARVDEQLECWLDWQMISTILRNLMTNAIKFTPAGGYVELKVNVTEQEVIFEVSDNGVGMTEERVKSLFDANHIEITTGTADEKGTGLGLLVCKEFTKAHGGSLTVKSEQGKGSTFTLRIPQPESVQE